MSNQELSYEDFIAEAKCEECGNTAPKRQIKTNNGLCGRCQFNNSPEENKTYYRPHEQIDVHEHRKSDKQKDNNKHVINEWSE